MNKTLRDSANNLLHHLIPKLNEEQLLFFKRIYSQKDLNLDIDSIIANIKDNSISHAIALCENLIYEVKSND